MWRGDPSLARVARAGGVGTPEEKGLPAASLWVRISIEVSLDEGASSDINVLGFYLRKDKCFPLG